MPAGEGALVGSQVGGRALEHHPASVVTCAGAEVDDPVGVGHHRLVVLDHDDRPARLDQPVEQAEQVLDVGEVEPGGRLVEHEDAAPPAQMGGQLESLTFATGQGRQRLTKAEVPQPDVDESGKDLLRRRGRGVTVAVTLAAPAEEPFRLGDRHGEHLGDVPSAQRVLQHLRLKPPALAHLARGGHARHDAQVGVEDAGAFTLGTGTVGVGAEQRRLDVVGRGEGLADRVERLGVGGRVAAARPLDRTLIHGDHPVPARQRSVQQRALSRPGDAGDDDEHSQRDIDVDVGQVVRVGTAYLQRLARRPHRRLEDRTVVEVAPGDRVAGSQPLDGALVGDRATRRAGTGPQVDDVVGDGDRLRVVLDDQHGVALVPQTQQQRVHACDVVGVEPDGGLVEHVGDVGQR